MHITTHLILILQSKLHCLHTCISVCDRCYISVAVLDGKIYALGGYDGQNRQNSAERYDPTTNQWSLIAPMHQQRSDASATTLNGRNKETATLKCFGRVLRIRVVIDYLAV